MVLDVYNSMSEGVDWSREKKMFSFFSRQSIQLRGKGKKEKAVELIISLFTSVSVQKPITRPHISL